MAPVSNAGWINLSTLYVFCLLLFAIWGILVWFLVRIFNTYNTQCLVNMEVHVDGYVLLIIYRSQLAKHPSLRICTMWPVCSTHMLHQTGSCSHIKALSPCTQNTSPAAYWAVARVMQKESTHTLGSPCQHYLHTSKNPLQLPSNNMYTLSNSLHTFFCTSMLYGDTFSSPNSFAHMPVSRALHCTTLPPCTDFTPPVKGLQESSTSSNPQNTAKWQA